MKFSFAKPVLPKDGTVVVTVLADRKLGAAGQDLDGTTGGALTRAMKASRFTGKRVYVTGTKPAIRDGAAVVTTALAQATVHGASASGGADASSPDFVAQAAAAKASKNAGVPAFYKHLMTGVSFMLPFVVAGGLIIALSFVFGIEAFKEEGTLAAALMKIGGETAFQLMVPLLAGRLAAWQAPGNATAARNAGIYGVLVLLVLIAITALMGAKPV